ncbi:MAG: SBBP repeat-containing protein, partial [Acidimicrobiia bacterium]
MKSRTAKVTFWAASIIVVVGLSLSASMLSGVAEQWRARYSGPGNGDDSPLAIALDAAGRIIVTGTSFAPDTTLDFATVKYDRNGNRLWADRYDGPGHDMDVGISIAVGPAGHVYVTGKSLGADTNLDYATIKYDELGNRLWIARYNGTENNEDIGMALAVDVSGNVYVTGDAVEKGNDFDIVTIKYDGNGTPQWIAKYDGPAHSVDAGSAIAVDSEGNVYVTGMSVGTRAICDFVTIKYDASGRELWVARHNSYGDFDGASRLALGKNGTVHVTGRSVGTGTSSDYLTITYDAAGNELWAARYDGPAHGHDRATSIAVGDDGSVSVTGLSTGIGTGYDYATITYEADGRQRWVARYDGPANRYDGGHWVGVDSNGDVYVTGKSYGISTGSDYATVKYDSTGTLQWVIRHEGMG